MAGNDQLTALDAAFLELEQADDGALMHIGAALVFGPLPGGGTPAIGEVREQLEQRLELLPRYRQKLGTPRTGGLAWPSWERDERFECKHRRMESSPACIARTRSSGVIAHSRAFCSSHLGSGSSHSGVWPCAPAEL